MRSMKNSKLIYFIIIPVVAVSILGIYLIKPKENKEKVSTTTSTTIKKANASTSTVVTTTAEKANTSTSTVVTTIKKKIFLLQQNIIKVI